MFSKTRTTIIHLAMLGLALGGFSACASEDGVYSVPDKNELKAMSKADGVESLCHKFNQPPDCDLCELYGFYNDGVCDQWMVSDKICKRADPDCWYTHKLDAGVAPDTHPISYDICPESGELDYGFCGGLIAPDITFYPDVKPHKLVCIYKGKIYQDKEHFWEGDILCVCNPDGSKKMRCTDYSHSYTDAQIEQDAYF